MSKKVENGTLSYRILANDFRKEIKALRTNAKVSRVAKRSFESIFAGQDAEEKTDASDTSTKAISKRKKKKTGKQSQDTQNTRERKRQHSQTTDQTTSSLAGRIKCHACEQDHDFHHCYYLFPKKAPDFFKSKKTLKLLIEQNLKDDNGLAEKVKRLQKSMDNTTITETKDE